VTVQNENETLRINNFYIYRMCYKIPHGTSWCQ